MLTKKSKYIVWAFMIAAIIVISACSNGEKQDTIKLRVGYAPITDAAQLYIAIEKHFFSDQGIEVQLEQLGSGAKILEAVSVGSVDIGLSSYVPLVLANASGLQLQALTGGVIEDNQHPEHAILVKKGSNLKTVEDLRGKTVALNGRRNIDHMVLVELLKKHGMTENDIKIVEIPFPRMEQVLISGDVDAICSIEPFVSRATQDNKAEILIYNFLAVSERTPIAGYVAQKKWLIDNQDIANKFITAMNNAVDYLGTNTADSRKIIAKYTNISEDEMSKTKLPAFEKAPNAIDIANLIIKMKQNDWIKSDIDSKGLIYDR